MVGGPKQDRRETAALKTVFSRQAYNIPTTSIRSCGRTSAGNRSGWTRSASSPLSVPLWVEAKLVGVLTRGAPVTVRTDLLPVPIVQSRGSELREVLINLVLNAVDAMPNGGMLTLRTAPDGEWAVVQVADTGEEIPPAVRRRNFGPFFMTKDTGTGLGLSIVSGIVSSYGGTIDVESDPGAGATFTIRLPGAVG